MGGPIKVVVVGATGRTGQHVVDGLLSSTDAKFEVTATTRDKSLSSEAVESLKSRGVKVVAPDLKGPKEALVSLLSAIDVVVSCISFFGLNDQISLIEAAKEAGVKRFVPCNFGTPAPRGVSKVQDMKLDILDVIQRLYVPYTVIDVGWWSNQVILDVPSGRTRHAVVKPLSVIPGDGNIPFALTDARDIGMFVAKVIADPRTINHSVLAYTEILTFNQIADLLDEVSGEKTVRNYRPAKEIKEALARAKEALDKDPTNQSALLETLINGYFNSWGLRGDASLESATYLGYLDSHTLYPGVKGKTLREIYGDILDGKSSGLPEMPVELLEGFN